MQSINFDEQMQRLRDRYGEKTYSLIVITTIWKEFSWMETDVFKKLIDQFLTEMHRAPLLKEFRELAGNMRLEKWRVEKQQNAEAADNAVKFLNSKTVSGEMRKFLKILG